MAHNLQTLATGFVEADRPCPMLGASGRWHLAFYYDDGANQGIYHAYSDDITSGWTLNASVSTGLVNPSSPVLIQENDSEPNPGRIHCYWMQPFGGATPKLVYESHSDDDGVTWSAPASIYDTTGYVLGSDYFEQVDVIRCDTGRWIFMLRGTANYQPICTFYTDDLSTYSDLIYHTPPRSYFGTAEIIQLPYGRVVVFYRYYKSAAPVLQAVGYFYSIDRGEQWYTTSRVQYSVDNFTDPAFYWLDDDSMICAYATDTGGTDYIECTFSNNMGYTWDTPPVTVYNATTARYPSVVQLNSGEILCAFEDSTGGAAKLVASNDRGATWAYYGTVTISASALEPHMIEIDPTKLICAYQDSAALGNIQFRTSTDKGATWSAASVVTPDAAQYPGLTVDSNGNLYCVYEKSNQIHLRVSDDDGATWGDEQDVESYGFHPRIQCLDDDTLQIVYATILDGEWCVAAYNSYDLGVSWRFAGVVAYYGVFTGIHPSIYQTPGGDIMVGHHAATNYVVVSHQPYGDQWGVKTTEADVTGVTYRPLAILTPDSQLNLYAKQQASNLKVNSPVYAESLDQWHGWEPVHAGTEIQPVDANHDITISDDNLMYAYAEDPLSGDLHTVNIVWVDDVELVDDLESFTGMEAPQVVIKWANQDSIVASGSDGIVYNNSKQFDSASGSFMSAVNEGDKVVIANTPPTAGDGIYTVGEVVSDTQLMFTARITPGAMISNLNYTIVRDLPDSVILRRKELEYPRHDEDGNVRVSELGLSSYSEYYADFGESVVTGADGETKANGVFESLGSTFNTDVNPGDWLIISDSSDVRNNGIHPIEIVNSATQVTINRDLPLSGITGLTFQVWAGPLPYRTYYYSLFAKKQRPETVAGTIYQEYQTYCFTGGNDAVDPTFKTKLWSMLPKVVRDNDLYKIASTIDAVIDYGEVIYRDDSTFIAGHLERLARMFGLFIQRASDLVDNFQLAWTPRYAPPEVVDDLTETMGFTVNRALANTFLSRRRKFLRAATRLIQTKGTRLAMERMAAFYGYDLEVSVPVIRRTFDTCTLLQNGGAGDCVSGGFFNAYRNTGTDGKCYGATDPDLFESASGRFYTYGVKPGDILTITGGANAGTYEVSQVLSEIQLELTTTFPGGDTTGDTWSIRAILSEAASGDLLKLKDPTQEDNNGNWIIETVNQYGYDLGVAKTWTTSPLSGLVWEIWSGYYFDQDALLDSYSTNWVFEAKIRLYKDGVYQLWELEDTQLVFTEIMKVTPHNVSYVYNEEAP